MDRYEETGLAKERLHGRTDSRWYVPTKSRHWGFDLLEFVVVGAVTYLIAKFVYACLTLENSIPLLKDLSLEGNWPIRIVVAASVLEFLLVWRKRRAQKARDQKRREAMKIYPNEPALADFNWDPRGYGDDRKRTARGACFGILLWSLIFLPLDYAVVAYTHSWSQSALIIGIPLGLFNLGMVAGWWQTVVLLGRARRFGDSKIEFSTFPYRLGNPIDIHWHAGTGVRYVRKGTFTLRQVEETSEWSGGGKNGHTKTVYTQCWAGTWFYDEPFHIKDREMKPFRFDPPVGLAPTHLSSQDPVYWEFEVNLDLDGFDFEEIYLVPVYAS